MRIPASVFSLKIKNLPIPQNLNEQLVGIVRDVPQHILHVAGQNVAEIIEGGGRDISVVLQRIQRPAAEGIILNERIRWTI